jgi:hypothetical protein
MPHMDGTNDNGGRSAARENGEGELFAFAPKIIPSHLTLLNK